MNIFICYRREDTIGVAGRLYDRIAPVYGDDCVFMDVDAIPLGVDFRVELSNQVARADVFLALIGKHWLNTGNLSSPTDYVRIEIEAALRRQIPVVPLLIGHEKVPLMSELPEALADLAFRNAMRLDPGRDFHANVDSLLRALARLERQQKVASEPVAIRTPEQPEPNKLDQQGGPQATRVLNDWVNELSRTAGNWMPTIVNPEEAPPLFGKLFVCLEGSDYVAKGAIVRGKDWAKNRVNWYAVVYGYCKGKPGDHWAIKDATLSHVAAAWRPELAALSDAIFAQGGKALEAFTPGPILEADG